MTREAGTAMQSDKRLQEWRDSAPYWAKHSETIRTMFASVTQALIEEAHIKQGQRVLDVAGGAGEPSLTIAQVVRPSGSVTYTDPIAEMLAAAQRQSRRRELTNLSFHQCAADSLPFADDHFDAVVCRLGIMFFPDPAAGLHEMLRVTKPGGFLSLVVWGPNEGNPFSYVVTNVLARYVQPTPAADLTHDAFSFADPGKLADVIEQAGAINVRERTVKFRISAQVSPKEFWSMRSETSGTLRDKLAVLPAAQREAIAREVQEAVLPFFPNNQMSFPAEMLIVSGTKRA